MKRLGLGLLAGRTNGSTPMLRSAGPSERQVLRDARHLKRRILPIPKQVDSYFDNTSMLVTAPAAKSRVYAGSVPRINQQPGVVRIKHRELFYTAQLSSSTFLAIVNSFRINPANPVMFPYLSGLANLFDEYYVHDLCIEYVPTCSSATAGYVTMAIDPDSNDALPSNRGDLLSYEFSSSIAPWGEACLKGGARQDWRFCDFSAASNPRVVDYGQFIWAAIGPTALANCGDFFVHYDISLRKPQAQGFAGEIITSASSGGWGTSNLTTAGTQYAQAVATGTTSYQLILTFLTVGTYYITGGFLGTSLSGGSIGGTATSQASAINITGTTFYSVFDVISVTAPQQTVTISITNAGQSVAWVGIQKINLGMFTSLGAIV